jgi:hypothetical protein
MKPRIIVVTKLDKEIEQQVRKTDQKTLAIWAADCAQRVLPYFEEKYPDDVRPREAIAGLRAWVETQIFKMKEIRKFALDSHAAAREVGLDLAARAAARSAGQAVATAHTPLHALAAGRYAATAVFQAKSASDEAALAERQWQYSHLLKLKNGNKKG